MTWALVTSTFSSVNVSGWTGVGARWKGSTPDSDAGAEELLSLGNGPRLHILDLRPWTLHSTVTNPILKGGPSQERFSSKALLLHGWLDAPLDCPLPLRGTARLRLLVAFGNKLCWQ